MVVRTSEDRALHEGRGEVVNGLRVRAGHVDQDDVGAAAGREAADRFVVTPLQFVE